MVVCITSDDVRKGLKEEVALWLSLKILGSRGLHTSDHETAWELGKVQESWELRTGKVCC